MSLILTIDTSSEQASICLSGEGKHITTLRNNDQKNHATWIHKAIDQLFEDTGSNFTDLSAVGLTVGPGSYTGLRVGMATAKGICYALQIPLIGIDSLLAMSYAHAEKQTDYLCPMIDAGRMEVYTALYNKQLEEVVPPHSLILHGESFSDYLADKTITFFGSGKNKFSSIAQHRNAVFNDAKFEIADLSPFIHSKFLASEFSSVAYLEPLYLKEFGSWVI